MRWRWARWQTSLGQLVTSHFEAVATSPSPVAFDWVLAGVLGVVLTLESILVGEALAALCAAVSLSVLPWRRRVPTLAVIVAALAAGVASAALSETQDPGILGVHGVVLSVTTFGVARWAGSVWRSGAGVAAAAASLPIGGLLAGVGPVALVDTVPAVAIGLFGAVMRHRWHLGESRVKQREAGVRLEIARDVHDTVGHHLTAVLLQAQAAVFSPPNDPQRVFEEIEIEATESLKELRASVTAMRSGGPVDFRLLAGGDPPVRVAATDDGRQMDERTAHVLFRVAQEGVTNARRHGARRPIDVEVTVDADRAAVSVTSLLRDGHDGASPTGHGLRGAAERVAAIGGRVTWREHSGRWLLEASAPLRDGGR